jgi:predicted heme/steroid binding protein
MREFQVGDLVKFNHKRGHKGIVVGDEVYDHDNRLCYPVYWPHLNETHKTPWTVIRKLEVESE